MMKIISKKTSRTILAIPVIAFLTTSCSKDVDDLYDFIDNTKASSIGSVKPIPQFKPYQSFAYSASDLRDPFESNVDIDENPAATKNSLHPENDRPKELLESFPLDALSMVGTLEQLDNAWGLIKDPQNIVHKVKVGNYMGKNEGRVVKISETTIYLVEIVSDGIGGYIERDASIAAGK